LTKPLRKESSKRKKWNPKVVIINSNFVSSKEYNLILDEITSIIYSELIKLKSSPDLRSSSQNQGGTHAA
jgi:hypothetical protein